MHDKASRIMTAAEKLFMASRFDEVTLDDVSREARVGKGTIYLYFKDKEDLYHQIILSGMDELIRSLRQPDPALSPHGELQSVLAKVIEFHSAKHSLFALMHSEPMRGSSCRRELKRAMHLRNDQLAEAIAATIARGLESGHYRTDLKPKTAARLILGMVRSALWHKGNFGNDEEMCGALTSFAENGLQAVQEQR